MKKSELRQMILQEFKGGWFDDLSLVKQKEYIKDHPNSKVAKTTTSKNDTEKDSEEEPKKIYHFRNKITGSAIDIKLTADELEKKKEQLGTKWKLLSTEEYLRECVRNILKEELLLEKDISRWALDYRNLYALKIPMDDIDQIEDIVNKINKKVGDKGSIVLGGGLEANGKTIVKAWTQGNLGPEQAYQEVKDYLEDKYPKIKFNIKYGRMD